MSAKRAVNIYNMLPGDALVADFANLFSCPALEQKLEIVRQLELYNAMYDENLSLGDLRTLIFVIKETENSLEEPE